MHIDRQDHTFQFCEEQKRSSKTYINQAEKSQYNLYVAFKFTTGFIMCKFQNRSTIFLPFKARKFPKYNMIN